MTWTEAALLPLSTIGILAAVIVSVRVFGLRSLSKMSSFDFAVTISIGSVLGSVATTSTALPKGAIAIAALFTLQGLVSWVRSRRQTVQNVLDNTPILLMNGADFIGENLRTARLTENDVIANLRKANVLDFSQVRAVVLETTGDISVLHGDQNLDPRLLDGIKQLP